MLKKEAIKTDSQVRTLLKRKSKNKMLKSQKKGKYSLRKTMKIIKMRNLTKMIKFKKKRSKKNNKNKNK